MSLSAAVIDALLATGATREQIAAAMKADIAVREAEEAAKLERKRRGNRERQQRKRDSERNAKSRVTVRDSRDPSPKEYIQTPTREIPPKANALDPKPKKHRLPVDWEPKPFTPGSLAAQTVSRWEPGRLERELSKFRDHHAAAGTRWENWQAAWSKWVNNSDDFQRGRCGTGTPGIGKSQAAYRLATAGFDPDEPF